jgi:cell division protein FtsQ
MKTWIHRYLRQSQLRKIRQDRYRFGVRRILAGVAGSALLSLMLIVCHDLIIRWDYFRAPMVEIRGNQRLSREEVLQTAGIDDSPNVLAVNRLTARKRLLDHPWIRTAEVIRELPDRLFVHIQEHDALAVLEVEKRYLLNGEGRVFTEAEDAECLGLPLISGLELTDVVGENIPEFPAFSAAKNLLQVGRQPGCLVPNRIIQRVFVDRHAGITIEVKEPIRGRRIHSIRLGMDGFPEKYRSLESLIGYFINTHMTEAIEMVDLTDIRRIVVRPVGPESGMTGDHKEDV